MRQAAAHTPLCACLEWRDRGTEAMSSYGEAWSQPAAVNGSTRDEVAALVGLRLLIEGRALPAPKRDMSKPTRNGTSSWVRHQTHALRPGGDAPNSLLHLEPSDFLSRACAPLVEMRYMARKTVSVK